MDNVLFFEKFKKNLSNHSMPLLYDKQKKKTLKIGFKKPHSTDVWNLTCLYSVCIMYVCVCVCVVYVCVYMCACGVCMCMCVCGGGEEHIKVNTCLLEKKKDKKIVIVDRKIKQVH